MTQEPYEKPSYNENLELIAVQCLSLPGYDEIVSFTPHGGVDILRLIETGETDLITVGAGKETHSFERPMKEPLHYQHFDTLESYAETVSKGDEGYEVPKLYRGFGDKVHQEKFDELQSDIIEEALARSSIEIGSSQVEECNTCTDGNVVSACDCVRYNTSTYTDISGETVTSEGEPGCSGCSGLGIRGYRCRDCLGAGAVNTAPSLSLINNADLSSADVPLDVSGLIISGLVRIVIDETPVRRKGADGLKDTRISLDLLPLIETMGSCIDLKLSDGDFTTFWGGKPLDTWATSLGHLLQYPSVSIDHGEQVNASDIVVRLQKSLLSCIRTDMYSHDIDISRNATDQQVKDLANKFDLVLNEDMTIHTVGIRIEKSTSVSDNLQELLDILGQYNLRLGYALTGIATGESGPAFYFLDSKGNVLEEIAAGYDPEVVLDNALRLVREHHQNGNFTRPKF